VRRTAPEEQDEGYGRGDRKRRDGLGGKPVILLAAVKHDAHRRSARELLKRPAVRFDAFGCGSLSRVSSSIALTGPQGPGIKAATVN
jgi:predicted kinase